MKGLQTAQVGIFLLLLGMVVYILGDGMAIAGVVGLIATGGATWGLKVAQFGLLAASIWPVVWEKS